MGLSRQEYWSGVPSPSLTVECYSALKRNEIVSFAEIWIKLETVTQSEVNQKEKDKYCTSKHTCRIQKNGPDELICRAEIETHMWTTNI